MLSPEQDLTPGMISPFRQVALKESDNSSGSPSNSNSTLDRIFWKHRISKVMNMATKL